MGHQQRFETEAVHHAQEPEEATGAVIPPIYATSTYAQIEPSVLRQGFDYSRADNPTRRRLEQVLAALEGARYGVTFASGVAATSALLALLEPGDHVLAIDDTYGGTYRLFERVYRKYGIDFTYADLSNLKNVKLRERTKFIWLETPTNPLLKICDISGVAARKRNALLIVDNTFASPYLQRPIELDADVVLHSMTKYLGGHSDIIGGALVLNDKDLYDRLKFVQLSVGAVPSPFDCWLVHRGLKTLALRMRAHSENGLAIARMLAEHRKVRRVYYPGLEDHPNHQVAARQMSAYSGMVSFELNGNVKRFLKELKLFTLAESLGGVESLVNHPALMTHASIPREERLRRGITDDLIRLSVGIEHPEDLIDALSHALKAA
jgi:cystathionine beta-lyase/cystathionine gamma-synthase